MKAEEFCDTSALFYSRSQFKKLLKTEVLFSAAAGISALFSLYEDAADAVTGFWFLFPLTLQTVKTMIVLLSYATQN